jgi:hypothetical protein
MSKKPFFIRLFGIMAFSILFIPTASYADQYYDQYPGNSFFPDDETVSYEKGPDNPYLSHDDTDDKYYYCPINFNVPDGSTYFIKSIGMLYKDNLTDGYLRVRLYRQNLYTSAEHLVADWSSGKLNASVGEQTASHGTISGFKLVDSKKFAYWLCVYFYRDGDVNPGSNLVLYQVRIHYGT